MSNEITLRPYQQECVDLINSKEEGKYLIALATGLGKTVIFSNLKRKGRTLILSHRDELVHQPEKYFTDCTFGVEKADEHSNGEDVVSASVQTLSRDNRLQQFHPDEFHTIIVDEAHHAAAPTYKKILNYFSGAKLRLGMTATPRRGDNVRLDDVFDEILYEKSLRWGIQNHYLTNIHCMQVQGGYVMDGVKKTAGDFNLKDLSTVLSDSDTLDVATNAYIDNCLLRHTLIYCVSIDICYNLLDKIKARLPKNKQNSITVLTGQTPGEEREQILQNFMSGNIMCIINCMVLTEGTDLPIVDTIINLRPTCNDSLYQQMIGRGTRLYNNKDHCLVIDILPEESGRNRQLCVAPSLFGIDFYALSKKKKQLFTEETDLMSLCDEIEHNNMDIAKRLEMVIQEYELFASDCTDFIHRFRNLKQIVKEYDDYESIHQDDIDFGNLIVHTFPAENERYVIYPTFTDRITLSTPDVLGNTTVTFHTNLNNILPEHEQIHKSDALTHAHITLKLEDALILIRNYLECQPPYTQCSWNHNIMELWKKQSASDKQIYTIKKMYPGKQGYRYLSKYEASRLIDLNQSVTNANKLAQCYIKGRKLNPEEKETLLLQAKQIEDEKNQNDLAIIKNCITKHQHILQEKEQKAKSLCTFCKPVKGQPHTYHMNNRISPEFIISSKQLAFLQSLLKTSNIQFKNLTVDHHMPMYVASALIDILQQNKKEHQNRAALYHFDEVEDALQWAQKTDKSQYILTLHDKSKNV